MRLLRRWAFLLLCAAIVSRPVVPLHAGCQVDVPDGPIGTGSTPGQAENQCDIIAGGVAQGSCDDYCMSDCGSESQDYYCTDAFFVANNSYASFATCYCAFDEYPR